MGILDSDLVSVLPTRPPSTTVSLSPTSATVLIWRLLVMKPACAVLSELESSTSCTSTLSSSVTKFSEFTRGVMLSVIATSSRWYVMTGWPRLLRPFDVGNGILRPTTISASSLSSAITLGLETMFTIWLVLSAWMAMPNAGMSIDVTLPEVGSTTGTATVWPKMPNARPARPAGSKPSELVPNWPPTMPVALLPPPNGVLMSNGVWYARLKSSASLLDSSRITASR